MSDKEGSNTQSFSNDQLQVTVTKEPLCKALFDITVQPAAVVAAYQKAIKNVSKEVSIPGFRKGRAPENFIIEKFPSQIDQEWKDTVLNTAFIEALSLARLQPLKTGKTKLLKFPECSKETGAKFVIEFEVTPMIPQIVPSELHLKKIAPKEVTPKLEADFLARVQRQSATFEPVTGRPVQEGDFIDLEIEALNPEPRRLAFDKHLEVAENGLTPWIREKVIGLNIGENVEAAWQTPEGEAQSSFTGEPVRFTVHAIYTGQIPAADDELAKKVGLPSLDALKEKLRERLNQDVEAVAQERREAELKALLKSKYPFDLPHSMIEEEATARFNEYLKVNKDEGREIEKGHLAGIKAEFERISQDQLQFFFLLRRFIAEQKIELTEADINNELQHQISLIPSGKSALDLQAPENELRDQIQRIALSRKAIQFLLDHANVE